nr:hypothetical protein DGKKSRWO_DGKKSRWO_CDS_0033 [uncultured phage]CAI9752164.1 hypothetical protein CVNMHQAP_CVNMHQAP_CDS_0033 [uncultured phage]
MKSLLLKNKLQCEKIKETDYISIENWYSLFLFYEG